MMPHYPDLGTLQWREVTTANTSASTGKDLGSDMSSVLNFCLFAGRHFMEKTSGSIIKCQLFSQASMKSARDIGLIEYYLIKI